MTEAAPPLLDVDAVKIGAAGFLVVDSVSFTLGRGESLGIAGESGSGKSTLLLALMGLMRHGLQRVGGSVRLNGLAMLGQPDQALQAVRGSKIALIPQNPATALNPSQRIGTQIDEVLRLHSGLDRAARGSRVADLLARVHLPDSSSTARRYPHELSGGQVQRAAIAMALAGTPEVLLLDEPTTGLDVTTQAALLDLLTELRRAAGVAMICVSHDLGVLARLCDQIGVMYAGAMIEQGPLNAVLTGPGHPYTRALLASIPRIGQIGLPAPIDGSPPSLFDLPKGCRYAPRCPLVQEACSAAHPALRPSGLGRQTACLYPMTGIQTAARAPETLLTAQAPILAVEGLWVGYPQTGRFGKTTARPVVQDVSFALSWGEVLGLVGESGSGKSTILRAIAGLVPPSAGMITLMHGERAEALSARATDRPLTQLRRVQLVFQNPDASLNPRHRVLDLLAQPLRLYGRLQGAALRDQAAALLSDVRLPAAALDRMPSQLSGGERQRVAIARAFAASPDLLLCDEITTALDVSVQAAVLELIRDLARLRNVAAIFVSHDLAVVHAVADRIAVLHQGKLVEIGTADAVCARPEAPYTKSLLASVLPIL